MFPLAEPQQKASLFICGTFQDGICVGYSVLQLNKEFKRGVDAHCKAIIAEYNAMQGKLVEALESV